jgi:PAS domain S-box-containing protein
MPEEIAEPGTDDNFAKLFERIADAAILFDIDTGTVREANAAARGLLGYGRHELGRLRAQDIHPHELPALNAFVDDVLRHGDWERADLSCRARDGVFVPARVRATYVEAFGRRCVLSVIHDLRTDRLAELGQAVRKVSHDLRNVLANAVMLAETLSTRDDPQVQRLAQGVLTSVDRAIEMCRRSLSAGTAAEPRPAPERLALAEVAQQVAAELPSRTVGVTTRIARDLTAHADRQQVHRILLNLLRNAADAEGTRTIRIEGGVRPDGWRSLDVVDDGPGLPAAREGTRPADLARRGGGTGLGLQIAEEMASLNAGALDLVATNRHGTRFRLWLPG